MARTERGKTQQWPLWDRGARLPAVMRSLLYTATIELGLNQHRGAFALAARDSPEAPAHPVVTGNELIQAHFSE